MSLLDVPYGPSFPESPLLVDLSKLSETEIIELACQEHLGVWAERKRGFVNAALHWEWSELAMTSPRLCVVAPREHAKSEVFTVNQVTWACQYTPGLQAYCFAQTGDQATKLKERIDMAMWETAPWMMEGHKELNSTYTKFANWSSVSVAGAGKSVRGAHPDLIVGDDVLEEGNCLTHLQRQRIERWWKGTIGGMSHPGTTRTLGDTPGSPHVEMKPTRVHLVGTPFHAADLLMSMKENPLYRFRRYSAEYDPFDLPIPGSLAVESA